MFRVEGLHFSEGKVEVVWIKEGNTGGRDWEEGGRERKLWSIRLGKKSLVD